MLLNPGSKAIYGWPMATETYRQLLGILHERIIPEIAGDCHHCVTWNEDSPQDCEVRSFRTLGGPIQTIGSLHVGNPHIYEKGAFDGHVRSVLSRYQGAVSAASD